MVQDIFILVGMLLIFLAPILAVIWIIYRLIKGSGGNNNSITGN
jgi:flagellar biogenesis protein FliO